MENDPLEFASGYVSPLTDREHARIGRIAVLWGQIEYFVEELIEHVSGMTPEELNSLQINKKPIGSQVSFLNAIRKRHPEQSYQKSLEEFCSIIHETKTDRNHVFHGLWGWRAEDRSKRVFAAARKSDALGQPFKHSKLASLEKKLCKCSRMGQDLCQPLWKVDARPRLTRFVHHDVEAGAPEWLKQWSKHNPLGDAILENNAKAGQLLRLSELLPEK